MGLALWTPAAIGVATVLPSFLFGAVAPALRGELGLSTAQIGFASSAALGSGILAMAMGRVADWLGASLAARAASWGAGLAMASVGLIVGSFPSLIAAMLVAGVALALGGPASSRLIASGVAVERQGLAFGIKQAAPPVCAIISGVSVPLLLGPLGVAGVFVSAALFAVGIGCLPLPREEPLRQTRQKVRLGELDRGVISAMVAMALGFVATASLQSFWVDYLVIRGLAHSAAGVALSVGALLAVAVRIAVGRLIDRQPSNGLRASGWMMLVGGAGYVVIGSSSVVGMTFGSFVAFVSGWGWSGLLLFGAVRLKPAAAGTVAGMVLGFGAIGGLIGPSLFGLLAANAGYSAAWGVVGAMAAIGGLVLIRGGRPLADSESTQLDVAG